MLLISGCGDPGLLLVIPIGHVAGPPSITSYQFTQDSVAEFIDGSVDFYAPDADIDTITVAVFDSRNRVISRTTTKRNLQGLIRGRIFFSIDYATYPADPYAYSFRIYLTDFNGFSSNQVEDIFRVP
jgi:hypothetical protein